MSKHANRYSDETIAEIAEKRANGVRPSVIYKEYGISRSTLWHRLDALGLRFPLRFGSDVIEDMIRLYDSGKTLLEIGQTYGTDHHTVSGYLRRAGKSVRSTEENWGINGDPRVNAIRGSYVKEAGRRGVAFELPYEMFSTLLSDPCYYCGAAPSNERTEKRWAGFRYSGIDRIVPKKGYVPDNVASCCFPCNTAKGAMTLVEFRDWIKRMVKNDVVKKIDLLTTRRPSSRKAPMTP